MEPGLEAQALPDSPLGERVLVGATSPSRAGALFARAAAYVATPAARSTAISIVDQGVVSAANFLTTVVLGRLAGAAQLGVYSLGFTLVVMITAIQTALVTIPYTIYGNRLEGGARRAYAGSALAHYAMLSGVAMTGLLAAGVASRVLSGPAAPLPPVLWVLAGTIPFLLLRDFVRRFAFAHLRVTTALAVDVAVAAMQVGGLGLLALTKHLSAVSANLAIGVASVLAAGIALALMWGDLRVRRDHVMPTLERNWRLGKWIVTSHATAMLQNYAVHWLLAALLSAAATGVYAASMTMLLLANPLTIGIGNVLEPRAARAYAEGGKDALAHVVWSTTGLLGGVIAVYCVGVTIFGGAVVAWVYHGPQYAHQGATVAVLALATLADCLDLGAAHGLRVIERPFLSFRASLVALAATVSLGLVLVPRWGTLGGAYALLAGNVAGSVVRCGAFWRLTRRA